MGKVVFHGFLGSLVLVLIYLLLMRLGSGSWDYTLRQLDDLKFWVIPLVLGFGIQVGLYSFLKSCQKAGMAEGTAAGGSVISSTTAMLACCAHHLTDILPFLGLTAAATFLATYQEWFLGMGILSNLWGIFWMVRKIRKIR